MRRTGSGTGGSRAVQLRWETQRIYVGRIGPVGLALLILMIGVLAALILLTVVGAVLLWIPILVLAIAAGAMFRLLRR